MTVNWQPANKFMFKDKNINTRKSKLEKNKH